jgi:hypothetical protein
MFWKSTAALATILALANASPHSPVSDSEIDGIVCGIQKYGRASNWPNDQVQIVKDTMGMKDNGFYNRPGAS